MLQINIKCGFEETDKQLFIVVVYKSKTQVEIY